MALTDLEVPCPWEFQANFVPQVGASLQRLVLADGLFLVVEGLVIAGKLQELLIADESIPPLVSDDPDSTIQTHSSKEFKQLLILFIYRYNFITDDMRDLHCSGGRFLRVLEKGEALL